jgi:hypothetical protein
MIVEVGGHGPLELLEYRRQLEIAYRSSGPYSTAYTRQIAPTSPNHCVLLVSAGGNLLPLLPREVRTVSVLVANTKPREPTRKQDRHRSVWKDKSVEIAL